MQRIEKLNITEGAAYIDHVVDIYYLTGKKVSKGTLLVFPEKAVFFVDGRYFDSCKNMEGLEVRLDDHGSIDEFIKTENPKKIFIDAKTLPYNQYRHLRNLLPGSEFEVYTKVQEVRSIKDAGEVEKMKIAGALNYAAYEHAASMLKEGITEREVAWEYEKFCKERVGEELSFKPIIAFGENSAGPHYHTGNTVLKKGMAVLIDCGITVDSYTSDMTRCHYYKKEVNPEDYKLWKDHFDLVKKSYDLAAAKVRVGEMFYVLDEQVQNLAKQENVDNYVRHSLGHGLGLDVHEWPRISYKVKDAIIQEGMFFTIEPGLYFPGKWGIRYENTLYMGADKVEIISKK